MTIHKLILVFIIFFLSAGIYCQSASFIVKIKGPLSPISPYIYGTNQQLTGDENITARRLGGNRLTGYNWENNASNAGNDWQNSSDNYLTWVNGIADENKPGIVTTFFHDESIKSGAYSLITLQMAGYVAKDKNGTVTVSETAPSNRWNKVIFKKGSALSLQPNLSDSSVYIDEFVNFLVNKYGKANGPTGIKGYSLDNEPALWPSTHSRIHPNKTLCSEIADSAISLSSAVKKIDPYLEIFGPVLYGFAAYKDFQTAPDWTSVKSGKNYAWFIDYYLDKMNAAELTAGKRLLDVLDIHWYPEAQGDHRITESDATTPADIAARIQAPRTLWDKKYIEKSWITQDNNNLKLLPLLPKLKESISKFYPGTKLSITEFTYGGENHISGAIAMADAIGIFAKYGIYFASFWQVGTNTNYVSAAYRIYRNYDGQKSTFGDSYAPSSTSDSVNSSIYGSIINGKNEIHLVVINKILDKPIAGNFSVITDKTILNGRVWSIDATTSLPFEIASINNINKNSFNYSLPAGSVCHFVLKTSDVLSAIKTADKLPANFELTAYPNPFNPSCKIGYKLPLNSVAKIDIISITGSVVKSYDKLTNAGYLIWNGTNNNNQHVSSGVYCAILKDQNNIGLSIKIILLK